MNKTQKRGFTLVELLVVLAVATVLLAIVLPSFQEARKSARDKKRVADLEQMHVALKLYQDVHGYFPRESATYEGASAWIGNGHPIDAILTEYLGDVPLDPSGGSVRYYYDGAHACGGHPTQAILVARMENEDLGNNTELICSSWGGAGGTQNANAYIIVLGNSSG